MIYQTTYELPNTAKIRSQVVNIYFSEVDKEVSDDKDSTKEIDDDDDTGIEIP